MMKKIGFILLGLLVCGALFFTACQPATQTVVEEEAPTKPQPKVKKGGTLYMAESGIRSI